MKQTMNQSRVRRLPYRAARLGRGALAADRQRRAVLEHAPDPQLQRLRLRRRARRLSHFTLSEPYAGWKPDFEALTSILPFLFGFTLNVTMPSVFVLRMTALTPTPVSLTLAPARRLP